MKMEPGELAQHQAVARRKAEMSGTVDPFKARADTLKAITDRRNREVELESKGVQQAAKGLVATEQFRENYSRIVEDEQLNRVAQAMDRQQVARGDARAPAARYEDIGEILTQHAQNPELMAEIKYRAQYLEGADEVAKQILDAKPQSSSGERDAGAAIEQIRASRGQK